MKYGEAQERAERGTKVARHGWNGKGMYIFSFSKSNFCINLADGVFDFPLDDEHENSIHHIGFCDNDKFYPICDFMLLKTADNKCIPWNPSQADIFADDWEEVK